MAPELYGTVEGKESGPNLITNLPDKSGGKKAEALAKEYGWIWYPDQQTQDAGGKKHG